jgi:hypothetical protein
VCLTIKLLRRSAWAVPLAFIAVFEFGLTVNTVAAKPTQGQQPVTEVDWAVAARMDIDSIYSTLRDNHPGPVDTSNPKFSQWLIEGRSLAVKQAATATHAADYWRAVRLYTNGFRDGHIWFDFIKPTRQVWPKFLTMRDAMGKARVVLNDGEPSVPLGAELLACDGLDAESLQQKLVDPYRWNADIPHERDTNSVFLMTAIDDDPQKPYSCRFRTDDHEFDYSLRWSSFSEDQFAELINRATGRAQARIELHQVGPVWFVSLPTFYLQEPAQVDAMRALIGELDQVAGKLRDAPWVVLDVRGNSGGNSGWGREVAEKLFGKKVVAGIEGRFDWTVDWRVSNANAATLREYAAQSEKHRQIADARYRRKLADEIEKAAAEGKTYVRRASHARFASDATTGRSPFKGRVYLLTDHTCASACLDFADITRRLPGVVHIGLPTSADSIYIDNTGHVLPSNQGMFSWSLKVYRNRIRSNNEWYEPDIAWPGGPMTDAAVASWVQTLTP